MSVVLILNDVLCRINKLFQQRHEIHVLRIDAVTLFLQSFFFY